MLLSSEFSCDCYMLKVYTIFQTEVINESKAMVPDTRNRLVKAKDELSAALVSTSSICSKIHSDPQTMPVVDRKYLIYI